MAFVIRDATEADMDAIRAIYEPEVTSGTASFEEIPPTLDDMIARREGVLSIGLPYLVAEENGRVLGYAYASLYRARPAYRQTCESSVYIAADARGRGLGLALMEALIARCEETPYRQMVAVIGDSRNAGSVALHRRLGFRDVGTFEAVGFKLGRWLDTVMMQLALGEGATTNPEPRG